MIALTILIGRSYRYASPAHLSRQQSGATKTELETPKKDYPNKNRDGTYWTVRHTVVCDTSIKGIIEERNKQQLLYNIASSITLSVFSFVILVFLSALFISDRSWAVKSVGKLDLRLYVYRTKPKPPCLLMSPLLIIRSSESHCFSFHPTSNPYGN